MQLEKLNIKISAHALFFLAVIFSLSLLASVQFFGVSRDVENYEYFFDILSRDYQGRFEPLFVFISMFLQWIKNDFSFYIFALTFISISVKFYVLSRFRFFAVTAFIYLIILFPVHELTQYRVSISLAFVYLSFYTLHSNWAKWISYLIFLCAIFTHYSVAVLLPIVLCWHFLCKKSSIGFSIFLLSAILLAVLKQFAYNGAVDLNATLLEGEVVSANIFSARNFILTIVLFVGLFNWSKFDPKIKPFIFVSMYGFVCWAIFYDIPVFAHRLFELSFFSYLIWVGFLSGSARRAAFSLLTILGFYLVYKYIYVDNYFI